LIPRVTLGTNSGRTAGVEAVLAREGEETFELGPVDEAELLESIAEADRGELIPAEDVLGTLRRR
jgi:hypothetical protein